MSRAERGSSSEEPNTALLLRNAHAAIEDVVPVRLARKGHASVRRAHGVVFQHLDPDGSTVSVIAERAGMTKQAMAELVNHLEAHGYLQRLPAPKDRRAKLVQLTDKGHDVMQIVAQLVPEMEQQLRELLGDRRWRQLRHDLNAVHDHFLNQRD